MTSARNVLWAWVFMYPALKRYEALVLRHAGLSIADVSRVTGISPRSIRRIERQGDQVVARATGETSGARRPGRPSKTDPHRELIVATLREQPAVGAAKLLESARASGYAGGRSAFYFAVARARDELGLMRERRSARPATREGHEVKARESGVAASMRKETG